MRWIAFASLVVLGGCRPASYEKDVTVEVPRSSPSDGPDAAPGPRTRVLYPDDSVEILVPYEEVLPRGVKKKGPRD